MNTIFQKIYVCLLFSAVALSPAVSHAAGREQLRIMSFNIPKGNINASDGNGKNTWANRAVAIQHYVDSIAPDIMGIQEGVKQELQDLLAGMQGYAMVGCARNDGAESGEYTPILYRTERFVLEQSGNLWLTDTPDVPSKTEGAICYRVATWGLFTDKLTGARFVYTNTHLDHSNDDVRISQAKVLKEHMLSLSETYGKRMPQFLTADFNMNRKSSVYPYLLQYKLTTRDMWTSARKSVVKAVNGYSSTPDNEIDFIFAYGSISCSYAELGDRNTPDGYIMSDHNPIFADVSWTLSVADEARQAVSQAVAAADSTMEWQLASRTRLIAQAAQLTSDGIESTSRMANLIDRNTNTYVRSLCTSQPPNQPHYIQVRLNSPVAAFSLQYNRSQDGNTGLADSWQDVLVTASNDGEQWDYVTELHNFSGAANKTYTADVNMRQPYSHVRLQVLRTRGMVLANGAPRYSLSELQMYENTPKPTCDYAASQTVAQAVDALYAMARQTWQLAEQGTATSADIAALEQATEAMRQARRDFASPVEPVMLDGRQLEVYTTDGMKRGKAQSGLNIIVRPDGQARKVLVK